MRRRLDARSGALVFTVSQFFLGSVTMGISLLRGTESHLAFHVETLVGHANAAASMMARAHARAADAIANDNTISAAIMGPRFAVEADNITMDEDAAIACPQVHDHFMQLVCHAYHRNKPRARAKLAWARAKQSFVWQAMSQLSGHMDRAAYARTMESVADATRARDPKVRIRVDDPAAAGPTWGTGNAAETCRLAQKDTLASPMPGSAFPRLMPNLLGGLPKALVQVIPRTICGAGASESAAPPKLPEVPSVAKKTTEDCQALEQQMACEVSRAEGDLSGGACGGALVHGSSGVSGALDATPDFSSEVRKYVTCEVLRPGTDAPSADAVRYVVRRRGAGPLTTCTFDRRRCEDDRLGENTRDYLNALGIPGELHAPPLGSSTRAPTDDDWNHGDRFRVCAYASKPVNRTIAGIAGAARTLVSFGAAAPSEALSEAHEYRACARVYFPDGGESPFAGVPHAEQPFVAAWTFALTSGGR